jgi:hypothetical protein
MTSGCLIGMVQRHLLGQGKGFTSGNDPRMALAYYRHLKAICKPGNFLVEVFPHVCSHNWSDKVVISYQDGTQEALPTWKKVKTNEARDGIKVEALAEVWKTKSNRHSTVFDVLDQRVWTPREGRVIKDVRRDQGFVQNECRPWAPDGDVQEGCNRMMLDLANMHKDPVLISDDSHYARPEEKIVQEVRLASSGAWKFFGSFHRMDTQEACAYFQDIMGIGPEVVEGWVENSYAWASRFKDFGFKQRLSLPTKFYPEVTLPHAMALIRKHGRMTWGDPRYTERLASELKLLHDNGTIDLLPYFFVAEEVCDFFAQQDLLTGPGRGSAAGLLFSYLLSITHVDPIKYGLSQERFLTLDRIQGGKLPDIDQDMQKHQRHLLVDPEHGWLRKRFGNHYSQISTDTKLKLRSSAKDVARMRLGHVPEDVEKLTKKFLEAPQGIEDYDFAHGYEDADGNMQKGSLEYDKALMEYVRLYPKDWEVVDLCLGLARQKGRHPCGFVVCNEPVSNFIPTMSVADVTVTQYTAASVEAVGGLKMDYLGVNSLDDIAAAVKLVGEGCVEHRDYSIDGKRVPWFRVVPYKGGFFDIWDLPQEQAVFRDICEGRTETVFQFNTESAKKWFREFDHVRFVDGAGEVHKALDTDEALAAFTALDRPGPLDFYVGTDGKDGHGHNMLVEYARRASGERPTGAMPVLQRLLPETLGVIVYQEQLQKIFQAVGRTTALQADAFRVHISKKQMEKVYKDKAVFMPGAVADLGQVDAERLWDSMETFGKYGFNKSHAVCYAAKIGYACAWLKHYYPLQWWTSVLRNASKNEINENFWPYCGHMVLMPDVSRSGSHFQVEGDHIRAPIDLIAGIGVEAHQQLLAGLPYTDIDDFCQKMYQHKVRGGTPVTKVNKKTGKEVQVLRLGRSALHRGIVYKLIQGGCMDSLFPPETNRPWERLLAYEAALAKACGTKAVTVDFKTYGKTSLLEQYQIKKSVLPVFSSDLTPVLIDLKVKDVELRPYRGDNGVETLHGYTIYKHMNYQGDTLETPVVLVDGATLKAMDADRQDFEGRGALVACSAYVKSVRKFQYTGGDQGVKQALEVVLDVGGHDFKVVRWSGKSGRLESKYTDSPLSGAIVVAVLTKFSPEKPFCIEDLRVVQDPLNFDRQEESAGTSTEENPQ